MSPDPTESINVDISETPLDLRVRDAFHRIAQLQPSVDSPYVTVALDWRPEGGRPDVREGRRFFTDESNKVLEGLKAHTPEHETIKTDLMKIEQFLDAELSREAQGVLFVTCAARNVFEVLELHVPVENSIDVGPTPSLTQLSRVVDDFRTYAVLLADQKEAVLSFISQSKRVASVSVEGDDFPKRTRQGGFAQRRYQSNVDERIDAFARDVVDQVRMAVDDLGVDMLVIAGDEVIGSALSSEMHSTVKDRIVGTVRLDIRASEQDIIDATLPVIEQTERRLEDQMVKQVQDNLGTGEFAVAGPEDVLSALQAGQVMTLVMTDDFESMGWADYTLPVFGVGQKPKQHPAGGDVNKIVEISLAQELIRLAVQSAADVEIVHTYVPFGDDIVVPDAGEGIPRADAARALDDLGGVAAMLRFPLAIDQTTSEM